MAHTFISYRREDSAGYAGRLRESLERRLGRDAVFRDVDTLQPGQDFVQAIDARLRDCAVFVALIGREWLDAPDAAGRRRLDLPHDYLRLEIAAALARPDLLVIPVLVEGASLPEPDRLPEDIRLLARRQAVSIRDEAWDTDVERLAAVIRRACSPIPGTRPAPARRALLWAAAMAVVIALAGVLVTRGRDAPDDADARGSGDEAWPGDANAYGVPMPRNAEVAHGGLVYTPVSANVVPHGRFSTIRLRIRVSNRSRTDANFWDASFRLAVGDQVLAPTSGLNELVPSNSIREGIVTFEAPATARRAVLHVMQQDDVAEVPLDLSHTRAPPVDERAEVADSLSQAIFRTLIGDPRPLAAGKGLRVTLVRVTQRRFVNKQRIVAAVRVANEGRYAVSSGDVRLRLDVGAERVAPVEAPSVVIDANTSSSFDYVFEAPTDARKATLRASIGDVEEVVELELP